MNKKCTSCGFINFVTATECKKCEAVLSPLDETQAAAVNYIAAPSQGHVPPPTQPRVGRQILTAFACVFLGFFSLSMFTSLSKIVLPALGFSQVKWTEFHPPEQNDMTVMMPKTPKRFDPESVMPGIVRNRAFVANVPGQGTAVLNVIDYAGNFDWDNSEVITTGLEAELKGLVERTKADLISKNWVAFSGTQALEFVTQPPGSAKVYGKFFVYKRQFFALTIEAKEDTELFAGKDKFLNPLIEDPARNMINNGLDH